jgi:hypothetical protein
MFIRVFLLTIVCALPVFSFTVPSIASSRVVSLVLSFASSPSPHEHLLYRPLRSSSRDTENRKHGTPKMSLLEQVVCCFSTVTSAVGFYAYETRPSGDLAVHSGDVQVKPSNVEGAGLGLFAARDLPAGTPLGSYPGCVWPARTWLQWKGILPRDMLLPHQTRRGVCFICCKVMREVMNFSYQIS